MEDTATLLHARRKRREVILRYLDEVEVRRDKRRRRERKQQRASRPPFDYYSDEVWLQQFRFLKAEVARLVIALDIPPFFRTSDGSRESGRNALLILLRRLANGATLNDISLMFGIERTRVSRMATAAAHFLWNRWHHLLEGKAPYLTAERRLEFARAIRRHGAGLMYCWGFIDGRRLPICRPVKNQRLVYNGWKRGHCIAFQSLDTPDGMHSHVAGPVEGRRHDLTLLRMSGLEAWLAETSQGPNGEDLVIYGDSGYTTTDYIATPWTGAALSQAKREWNYSMSQVRECVEWGFADVTRNFAYLRDHPQRLLNEPVALWYMVGTLLSNARNCCHPNQTSVYFNCPPPTLEEYFSGVADENVDLEDA